MSSTNRGYERHVTDYYVTPLEPIKEFISEWFTDIESETDYNFVADRPDRVKWLDPCAGGDTKRGMSYPTVIRGAFDPSVLDTMDIREDSLSDIKGDYLNTPMRGYDVIITNPPFYLAKEIIEKALNEVNEGGYVVMLLRLNFLGSKARKQFFETYPPEAIYVHHKRMSFTEDNKTDSVEYAHMVWRKGHTPEFTKLKII